MMHRTPTLPTMAEAVAFVEAYGSASQKQDVRKAQAIFALHGVDGPDFASFPAMLVAYEKHIPKLSGPMPPLKRLIQAAGISGETYRQLWRAGRRLIVNLSGEREEKAERTAREDEWTHLLGRMQIVANAGLIDQRLIASLAFLVDTCRASHILPRALDADKIAAFEQSATRLAWQKLRKGLTTLDQLRAIPRLADLLPITLLTPPKKPRGNVGALPASLQNQIQSWSIRAAREMVEDDRYEMHAKVFSQSRQDSFRAALGLYLQTLNEAGFDLQGERSLATFFDHDSVDTVIGVWSSSTAHAALTYYSYASALAVLLERNDYPEEATYFSGLIKLVPVLRQGRAANKMMSPQVQRWCRNLLSNSAKTALFQIQHVKYYQLCLEAQARARDMGLDLQSLSAPQVMAELPATTRGEAKTLLRRVRMLGLLAAYTAIALEGAPYRRSNMLRLRHTGPRKTLYTHLTDPEPYVIINIPNEELKNGDWLTLRGDELDPITIQRRDSGDYGAEILRWYLQEIRPLFAAADHTHCFFPPVETAATSNSGFNFGTFYVWLAEGSAEIGLPMNSHNFRHGFCTIDINEGRRSMEDLARILGDTVDILRRNYAWIDTQKSVVNVQRDAARRRAAIMVEKKPK